MGIAAELDLVLSQRSVQQLAQDIQRAGQQLGTGLAAGATPAALNFSRNLVSTLQTRLATESAGLAKQLSSGILNQASYAAKAQELGRSITKDLNRGIASGEKLNLFQGQGGQALRGQLAGITQAATQTAAAGQKVATTVVQIGAASTGSSAGLSRVRNGLVQVALSATGTAGPLGRFASSLLLFAGGGGVVLAIAAGLAIIGTAIGKLTEKAAAGRKAADDLIKSLKDVGKTELQLVTQRIDEVKQAIAAAEERAEGLRSRSQLPFFSKAFKEDIERAADLRVALAALRQQQINLQHPFTVTTSEPEDVTAKFEKQQQKVKEHLRELKKNLEDARKAQEELTGQFNAFWDDIEAKANLAGPMVIARIKEMQKASKDAFEEAFGASVQESFERVGENLDLIERELNAIGEKDPVFRKFKQQVEDTRTPTERLRDNIHEITGALDGLLSRNGIALLGEDATRSLGSILNLADAIGNLRDNLGNITTGGIIGIASAGIGVVTGVVSKLFGKNKDPERLAVNKQLYDAAMAGDAGALEKLRERGQPGALGTRKATDDAWKKYQAAAAAQHEAAGPERAAEAERVAEDAQRAKDQAERERLDQVREDEERQVAQREQGDELASEEGLRKRAAPLGDAIMAQVAAAIAESRAADKIAEQSELGEDSPLARDARRRADEKIREAEQAVEEAERARGEGVEAAGSQVRRVMTESSASRVIGELTTIAVHTEYIPRIYDLLAGAGPPTRPTGGGFPVLRPQEVVVPVYLDGRLITEVVSGHLVEDFQLEAGLAGNASLPG